MTFCTTCAYGSDYSEHAEGCRVGIEEDEEEIAQAGAYALGLLGAALAVPATWITCRAGPPWSSDPAIYRLIDRWMTRR